MAKVLVCLMVFAAMSMMASEVQAACSLNDLAPCLNAVSKPNVRPDGACCGKVAAVDVPCFCNLVQKSSYPPAYINRAVSIPAACGGNAYAHFKGKNCAGTVLYRLSHYQSLTRTPHSLSLSLFTVKSAHPLVICALVGALICLSVIQV